MVVESYICKLDINDLGLTIIWDSYKIYRIIIIYKKIHT